MSNIRRLAQVVLTACMVTSYFGLFPNVATTLLSVETEVPEVLANTQSWGTLQIDKSVSQTPLLIQGRRYWKGIGTHAESTIALRVPEGSASFQGACGLDDQAQGIGEFSCAIRRRGEIVWQSSVISRKDQIRAFRIQLSPGDTVDLVVRATARGIDYAHADWVGLRFEDASSNR